MDNNKNRPVFLNLLKIRMPVTALVSIAHRISGIFLVFLIPSLVYLFDLSLQSEVGFHQVTALLDITLVKVACVLFVWAVALHFFAGLRFLLIDIDVGVVKIHARQSAWLVHSLALICMLLSTGLVL